MSRMNLHVVSDPRTTGTGFRNTSGWIDAVVSRMIRRAAGLAPQTLTQRLEEE